MRKVELNMTEQNKYEIIKKLVDNNGNKHSASIKLNCSIRTINRLINNYKKHGKTAFKHKNSGRKPAIAFSESSKQAIVKLYINNYSDTNLKHYAEIVKDELGITISSRTINKWLKDEYIVSPKARKRTKKQIKKELNKNLETSNSKNKHNTIVKKLNQIDSSCAHPRRSRCKYAGEKIQMDASSFAWIPNVIWHLHVAIDDATGNIVGAYFDFQETLKGYYNIFSQILINYGIPAMFYTDKRTVFEYKRKDTKLDYEDTFTQFSFVLINLVTK